MFGSTQDIGNDMTPPPPPPDHDAEAEVEEQAIDRTSIDKKPWAKPTIVRIDDGLTRIASGPAPHMMRENSVYFISS